MGDPAGVGPQITARAWSELRHSGLCFFVISDLELMRHQARLLSLPEPVAITGPQEAAGIMPSALPVLPLALSSPVSAGSPDPANAAAVIASIEQAADLAMAGKAAAMVTNPIAKSVLHKAGFAYPGHTEFLGALAVKATHWPEPHGPVMMLQGGGLRVALASVHLALRDVPDAISEAGIIGAAKVLDQALRHDFGLARPRIALCALNPHAGEEGAMGDEERRIINPAAQVLREAGLNISDAIAADTLFRQEARPGYDAVLAMYHDQGLIPVKSLDFHGGVNITLGLPFIRTSPDHGTGFAIAATNEAREDSLLAALRAAAAMVQCRQAHKHA